MWAHTNPHTMGPDVRKDARFGSYTGFIKPVHHRPHMERPKTTPGPSLHSAMIPAPPGSAPSSSSFRQVGGTGGSCRRLRLGASAEVGSGEASGEGGGGTRRVGGRGPESEAVNLLCVPLVDSSVPGGAPVVRGMLQVLQKQGGVCVCARVCARGYIERACMYA